MSMEELNKPMKGFSFWIWSLMIHLNWARSFWWAGDYDGIRRTELIAFCALDRKGRKAYSITIGPLKVTWGIQPRS